MGDYEPKDNFELCEKYYDGVFDPMMDRGALLDQTNFIDVIQKYCDNLGYRGKGLAKIIAPEPI